MSRYGTTQSPPEVLTEQEARAILNCIQGGKFGIRAKAMVQLMYRCGLRKGEVLNLHPNNIDIHSTRPYVYIRKSKFDKGRNIPIDMTILADLKAWDRIRPEGGEYFFCTVWERKANGISKGNPPGSKLSHNMLNDIIKRAAKRAGIERRVWPHMFRHTYATNILRKVGSNTTAGARLKLVQKALGHANVAVTDRYTHVSDSDLENLIWGDEADHAPPPPLKLIECSMCAEEVKPKAKICKHCGSTIKAAPAATPAKPAPNFDGRLIEQIDGPAPKWRRA